ncbi:MAG: mevalonate kinase [Proteobacteria bacterium]|nr:mevalonate kinase [Pseudomonadota bacterium]NIS72337.1 mevalonate kinase [Pseudomonadota bacterium]
MGRGTGFGKTILIGDQFVLEGVPAIVSSLSYETMATVERFDGDGWVLEDNRVEVPGYKESKKEQQIESINRILEVMKIDAKEDPIKIIFEGSLLAGSGVGASAASCVSLARALNEEFNLGFSTDEINQVAWEGEFAYHGIPSGVDNTASCYGGLMLYQLKDNQKIIEKIDVREPIEIVLGNSGVSANTAALDGLVQEEKRRDPGVFSARLRTITEQALEVKKGLEAYDLQKVGRIMIENHKILINMGLSHDKLIYLCDLALQNGAIGAKLTGGGMGGYMVAMTPGRDLQEKVASAIENEGFAVIRATVGGS